MRPVAKGPSRTKENLTDQRNGWASSPAGPGSNEIEGRRDTSKEISKLAGLGLPRSKILTV
jgi:hypothetical protein